VASYNTVSNEHALRLRFEAASSRQPQPAMGNNESRPTESSTLLEAPPPPPEPPAPPPDPYVPGRTVILTSSCVFVLASVLLLIEFILINASADATLINVFGALEGVGWVAGFALLIDWQVSYLFPLIGVSRRALLGAILKFVAAIFFNVQPFSWLVAGDSSSCSLTGVGVPWSNFVGICFFHSGNTIDALGMAAGLREPFKHENLPAVGMWIFWAATWLLIVADTLVWVGTPDPMGPGLETGVSMTGVISPLQITGATLLGVGSVLYAYWAYVPTETAK